jgi:anti-sigma regulatory factor (Ser/Thr protein kinase)
LPTDAARPSRALRLAVPAVLEAVEPVRREVVKFAGDLTDERRYRLELILEETLMNRVMHAGSPTPTDLTIAVEDEAIVLTFVDSGVAFDPLAPPPPRGDAPGGRGLMLTRRAATSCAYAREDGRNVFTVRLALA